MRREGPAGTSMPGGCGTLWTGRSGEGSVKAFLEFVGLSCVWDRGGVFMMTGRQWAALKLRVCAVSGNSGLQVPGCTKAYALWSAMVVGQTRAA